jgi:hypothetical protein
MLTAMFSRKLNNFDKHLGHFCQFWEQLQSVECSKCLETRQLFSSGCLGSS